MDSLARLQEHIQMLTFKTGPTEPRESVLPFPSHPQPAGNLAPNAAIELIYKAVEVVKRVEDRAKQTEAWAQNIAQAAVEKLQLANKRIQDLEEERLSAEARINDACVTLKEAADALRLEKLRVKAAEEQLRQLELRLSTAEMHANDTQAALARVEDEIRTRFLAQRQFGFEVSAVAA
jgi:chromosome segregation ATPase